MMWDTFITCDSVRCHGKRGKAWGGHIVPLYGPTFCAQEQPNVSSNIHRSKKRKSQKRVNFDTNLTEGMNEFPYSLVIAISEL